ncbi:MAG: arginine--tRNA ligase [Rhodospirillales bacterium]
MNIFRSIRDQIIAAVAELADEGRLPADLDCTRVAAEPPKDPALGDIASNAAMVLAAAARKKPRDIAAMLAEKLLANGAVAGAAVAGPGFLNLTLDEALWHQCLIAILAAGTAYGDSDLGSGRPVNVEYVSANPTGPLHVGHGRGAVVGDALAALLEKAGWRVTREYYVNDAGGQVDALARSAHLRYQVARGALKEQALESRREDGTLAYGGAYLIPVAEEIAGGDGDRWLAAEEAQWLPVFRDVAIARMMALIEADLAAMGIVFDVVTSERALVAAGAVEAAIQTLEADGLVYEGVLDPPKGKLLDDWEPRPQTLFRATRYGDEVDRPLRKSDGSWTYFAADIAYHLDKIRRGFPLMINVWGADHGGYVRRMQAAVSALSGGDASLDVKLCQLVNLLDGGEPVKMSKRAGTFITLREVIDRVGAGVFRFIMLTRKNDASLDFDFQKVTEQSRDNPVFYVQYAHARCSSVLRLAGEAYDSERTSDQALAAADLSHLADAAERELIRALAGWPRVVETAATAHEPHRIAFYLQEVAALFHALWTKGKEEARLRFICTDDPEGTFARLALVRATQLVIASGLSVIGVEALEELR